MESGTFTGNYKNDGVSGEFDSLTYPHSQEMSQVNFIIFIYYISVMSIICIYNKQFIHTYYTYIDYISIKIAKIC